MGCNCGKKNGQSSQYVYISATGQRATYNTEVEARAAQIRAGGGGTVQPA